eukprot:234995-Rhodomonas_salina.1
MSLISQVGGFTVGSRAAETCAAVACAPKSKALRPFSVRFVPGTGLIEFDFAVCARAGYNLKTDTDRDRHRQTEIDRDRDRQTDTDRDRDRQTDTDRDRDRQTDTDRDRDRHRQTDTDRQTQTDRHRQRQR